MTLQWNGYLRAGKDQIKGIIVPGGQKIVIWITEETKIPYALHIVSKRWGRQVRELNKAPNAGYST
jgi:hypothetical protein